MTNFLQNWPYDPITSRLENGLERQLDNFVWTFQIGALYLMQ